MTKPKKKQWTPKVGERVLVEATVMKVVDGGLGNQAVLVSVGMFRWLSDIRPLPPKRRKGKP